MEEKIDINRADEEALASLPGIGPARAAKIVAYRNDVHPFEEIIELTAVPGISERMVRNIADQITVNGADVPESATGQALGLPVEEIAAARSEDDDGAVVPPETPESPDAPEDDFPEGFEIEEEPEPETAEPPAEESETAVPAEEDGPVLVTFLEDRSEPEPERETADPPPQPEPETPSPPAVVERRVVETAERRHFHWGQQLIGVVIGIVLGASLALMLLYLLNGTLRFASENRATNLQLQLDEETSDIRQSQSSMADEMGELAGRVAELDNDLAASDEAIEAVEEDVGSLEAETAALNERLETIDLAAEKFDTFLSGLRDLLVTLQGLPPSPTATTTISGTATATATGTVEGTADSPTMTPTPPAETPQAGAPTRTPRPTATPIIE